MPIERGNTIVEVVTAGPQAAPGESGADGAAGQDGQDGVDGADGVAGVAGADGADGADGVAGVDGKSAYEISGFSGTEAEWISSLHATLEPATRTEFTSNYIYFDLGSKINRYDRTDLARTSASGTWAHCQNLEYT